MATISEALALAIRHHQAGRLQMAEQNTRQILAVEPNHADALHLLGVIAEQAGKHEVAIERIERAIALNGNVAAFHSNLGKAYLALHRIAEAVACCRRALELNSDSAEAHNNLGIAFREQKKPEEAVACYRRALELKPGSAVAHNNLGNGLKDQGKLDEAVACYRRALELKPNFAEAHNNLAVALKGQGKLDEAVACYRRALGLRPAYAEAHNNLGNVLKDKGKIEEAAACYRQALEAEPDDAEAHLSQSFLSLLTGDFERGWAEYEWRWETERSPARDFAQALWDGQPLEEKTILLHAEQGLGDAIQFVRYAPLVKRFGAAVVLECPKPLVPLLATCPGIDRLVAQGDEPPTYATHAPLLSLPGIFHTSLDTIPAAVPYLSAAPALIERWREKLREVRGYKIGINWQGRAGQGPWLARNIPLQQFATLAEVPGVRLISLQKGAGREELAQAREHFPVMDLGDEVDEAAGAFMDTAAIMMNLDLVITSDTAVPHVAGALGVPVWVALPFAPDWRWLLDRSDSPWYPTMRLFRQREPGNWHDVFQAIKQALASRLGL